ncbi:hypothetical protein [Salmonella enterica]|uniref:hypothetical protein n=1 Tax=Salmonella enterica TaxID=28901 RepID=UPI0011BF31A7|nr:hypothetical protein [Salmonella enterica]TXC13079.1 hypothetical protein DP148_27045 [Salmonella enterica subsp. enterica serovar Typhimurium]
MSHSFQNTESESKKIVSQFLHHCDQIWEEKISKLIDSDDVDTLTEDLGSWFLEHHLKEKSLDELWMLSKPLFQTLCQAAKENMTKTAFSFYTQFQQDSVIPEESTYEKTNVLYSPFIAHVKKTKRGDYKIQFKDASAPLIALLNIFYKTKKGHEQIKTLLTATPNL